MPEKFYLGNRALSLERSKKFSAVTGVRMLVDDETEVNAGTDTGYVWEIDSPWASDEQAAWLLSKMEGLEYQPYTADLIQLDPAAETGDYVTVGGIFGGLWNDDIRFGSMMTTEASAPQSQDIDHEAPYESASERKLTRLAKSVAAEFRVQADQISAKVSQIGGNNSSFGWEMTVQGMHWYANGAEVMKCTQAGLEVSGHIVGGTIQIGSNFSVDAAGNMKANSATLTGTLKVGGTNITAATLAGGAYDGWSWANDSYGGSTRWTYSLTGGGYGFNFNNMQYSSSSYAQPINASSLRYNGTQYVPRNIVVSGVTYTVLAVPAG